MATMNVNGIDLFYETRGSGDRIVLTHGAWTDGRGWQEVVDRLVDRYEVTVWDRRGHSRSANGDPPGSCRQDAADLAALIEKTGNEPVHLVGNSAGGSVVLNLVAMRPELVRSAAAHEPGPMAVIDGNGDPRIQEQMRKDKQNVARVNELIGQGEHRRAAEVFVNEVAVGPGAWEQFPEELRAILEANAPTATDDLRDAYDLGSVDLAALASTNIPVLISLGAESPGIEAAAARELARRIPHARLEAVDNAGHIPHRTHPDDYVFLLTEFIDGLGTTGAERVGSKAVRR